jgi:hypothetical protein
MIFREKRLLMSKPDEVTRIDGIALRKYRRVLEDVMETAILCHLNPKNVRVFLHFFSGLNIAFSII